ncbi:ZBBX-like protein [Mya arenaria]|uniref:ZBBX-like protein n=1 Tax=Mya arenaria TaxID=6604 RepID=A0ABY7G2H3_MYAAR|nr:ZBBX-like protein [Mya arenaria]
MVIIILLFCQNNFMLWDRNLKRAKQETRKLAEEGKKMEERLMELKMAMNREKEERERQGGGFWSRGQQGNLTTYADEVIKKNKNKSAPTKGKIKILKDKPLDLPERSNQPGTIAYIAQRGAHTPRDKPKGPKCGQCEERSAAVSCVQCSEDYCAGCFAAFHLKGNLKKHRSVPLMATPRQCFASPRPNPPSTNSSYDFNQGDGAVAALTPGSARKDRNSPEGASGTYENSLLHGSYDEAEQAASFQEALGAWRKGKTGENEDQLGTDRSQRPRTDRSQRPGTDRSQQPGTDRSQRRGGVPYSPVQTPTVNVDTSTATQDEQQNIEIKFNSSISYADRLLLKKHRRTDVDALFTPRETPRKEPKSARENNSQRVPRGLSGRGPRREKSNMSMKIEDYDDAELDEGRVDFQALYQAIHPEFQGQNLGPDSLSIVEVEANSGRKSARSSLDAQSKDAKHSDNAWLRDAESGSIGPTEKHSEILGTRLKDIENEVRKESVKSRNSKNQDSHMNSQEKAQLTRNKSVLSNKSEAVPFPSKETVKARPPSAKSRPQTGSKAKNKKGQGSQSRATSRQGSRPTSRANSRIGSSRAASRIDNPGLLTKAPSEALKDIARMTPTGERYQGIDSFFMVGVEPAPQEERTLTPSKHKQKDEKIKVSYQLYSMAPKSWKPDMSLQDAVDTEVIENNDAEDDRASSVMAYHAYSEQMMSDITERLISRFDELPLDEDSLSDQSSGGAQRSLGEEYRTYTSRRDPPAQTPRGQKDTAVQDPKKSPTVPSSACTPRNTSQGRARTPGVTRSRAEVNTPRRSKTFHDEDDYRPASRAIVMEGTDLSIFDTVGQSAVQDQEDEETLDQLEWELASQSGRLTVEGKISRMEMPDDFSDDSVNSSLESFRRDEMEDDEELTDDATDVRNLL